MTLIKSFIGIALALCVMSHGYGDDLSPAVPIVAVNLNPQPTTPLAPPPTSTSPIPSNLEVLANTCHADLNQSNTTDVQLRQLLQANDPSQATSLMMNTSSCRTFSEKTVFTFAMLTPKGAVISRGGVELNSPLATPQGFSTNFSSQLCPMICAYHCRPSVGIMFALAAESHGCESCAKLSPCYTSTSVLN